MNGDGIGDACDPTPFPPETDFNIGVFKQVINNNGGTAQPFNFQWFLTIQGCLPNLDGTTVGPLAMGQGLGRGGYFTYSCSFSVSNTVVDLRYDKIALMSKTSDTDRVKSNT